MGRIATTEDVEGIREEEDIGDEGEKKTDSETGIETEEPKELVKTKGKYVATLHDVQDAFDAINTLRYSQPTHLQGVRTSFHALAEY
jgi:cleavage and polyadenylation specificity factor subunit 2